MLIYLYDLVLLAVASLGEDPIREWILSEGKATQITGISPVGGGCINRASRYDTDAGSFFVKTNRYLVILMPTQVTSALWGFTGTSDIYVGVHTIEPQEYWAINV